MQRPAVLIFDLGGVLIENVGFDRLNALLPSALPLEEIKARWLASSAVRSFEVGVSSADSFASAFVDEWGLAITPSAFIEAFSSWPKGFFPGAKALLSQLRGHYTLACLSNSNAIHWERFDGFQDQFEVSLSSHLLGEVKPDITCFARALQECGSPASQTAFFDDSPPNICAAREIGMQAFLVNGPQEVRKVLIGEGWL